MTIRHVSGRKKGKVMLYALSTCVWCQKTKDLLNNLGVDYSFTDVDLLSEPEKSDAKEQIKKFNPACTFPTLVINDDKCIVGYQESKIREALKL
jgi:glutaredoxin-like protein NrdH